MLGDSMKRRHASNPSPGAGSTGGSASGRGLTLRRWLLLLAAVLAVGYGAGYLLATQVLFPVPQTAGTGVSVPQLYGLTLEEARVAIRERGLSVGGVRGMTSMDADSGRVLAQSPLPGQQLRPGGVVGLGVSSGPPMLRVPPVAGLGPETARELLEGVGFDVEVQQIRSDQVAAGAVARADPPAGTRLGLPATVTLVVSTGPSPEARTDSTPLGTVP